jgi:hypothetical protein
MKKFNSICATLVLCLSLSAPAFADDNDPGDSHMPGKSCPITTEKPGNQGSGGVIGAQALAQITGLTLSDILLTLASLA